MNTQQRQHYLKLRGTSFRLLSRRIPMFGGISIKLFCTCDDLYQRKHYKREAMAARQIVHNNSSRLFPSVCMKRIIQGIRNFHVLWLNSLCNQLIQSEKQLVANAGNSVHFTLIKLCFYMLQISQIILKS